jgi:hypothetical protein
MSNALSSFGWNPNALLLSYIRKHENYSIKIYDYPIEVVLSGNNTKQ